MCGLLSCLGGVKVRMWRGEGGIPSVERDPGPKVSWQLVDREFSVHLWAIGA